MSVKFVCLCASVLVSVMLTGCVQLSSETTIKELDPASGKVTKVTTTREGVIEKVAQSTQNKSIVMWQSGWIAYMTASIATTEDATPVVKMGAGKLDKGIVLLHKDHALTKDTLEGLAQVIAATHQNLTVSATGITNQSDNAITTTGTNNTSASASSGTSSANAEASKASTATVTAPATSSASSASNSAINGK